MSQFLAGLNRPPTEEEEEEEEEEIYTPLPLEFDIDFLAHSPSAAIPSTCHIPVLCMAEYEELPVLMSSLLYQRRVWRISEPLVGVAFLKYATAITLHIGWLDEDTCPGDALVSSYHC